MKKTIISLLIISFIILSMDVSIAEEHSNEGKLFVSFSALSSQYQYNFKDTLDELPEGFSNLLPGIEGGDDDFVNASLGIGYYWTDNISLRLNYVDGIEISDHDFCIIFCFTQGNEFNADMTIVEFDVKFRAQANKENNISFYLLLGAAYHDLDARVKDKDIPIDQGGVLLQKNVTNLGSKLGIGVQWDFLENFGASLGYTRYSFASIDKTYLEFEYRF